MNEDNYQSITFNLTINIVNEYHVLRKPYDTLFLL